MANPFASQQQRGGGRRQGLCKKLTRANVVAVMSTLYCTGPELQTHTSQEPFLLLVMKIKWKLMRRQAPEDLARACNLQFEGTKFFRFSAYPNSPSRRQQKDYIVFILKRVIKVSTIYCHWMQFWIVNRADCVGDPSRRKSNLGRKEIRRFCNFVVFSTISSESRSDSPQ